MKHRNDCFFGLHFDFHAQHGQVVPSVVDKEGIVCLLDTIHPDYIQLDTKGHAGLSSYPTEVGIQADCIREDMLMFWREETEKRGILLYAHHSGLMDKAVLARHPEWASVDENGEADDCCVSVFSPYATEFLGKQLLELAGKYRLDGAWIDGDCWAAKLDYGPYAQAAWQQATGCVDLPRQGEATYGDFCAFCRDAFEDYVNKYVRMVKAEYPDFDITSNWMYSHFMPGAPKVALDFLSGDYVCSNSVYDARHTGRCLAANGINWDLLSWGQNAKIGDWKETDRTVKEPLQSCQEAAMVLALGGGFELFNILYGTGGVIQRWAIPRWKEVADFCRARQALCWKAEPVPEIGVLFCHKYTDDALMFRTGEHNHHVNGWINALQNIQLSTSVVKEYQATEEMLSRYPLLILPSATDWQDSTITALKAYVQAGGTVIAEGESARFFAVESALPLGKTEKERLLFVDGGASLASLRTDYLPTQAESVTPLQCGYDDNYYHEPYRFPVSYCEKVGKGKLVTLCFDLSGVYTANISTALDDFCRDLMAKIGYEPIATVSGSRYVDVTVTTKNGDLLVNLINCVGRHNEGGVRTFNEIPPVGPLTVRVACDKEPTAIYAEPEHTPLSCVWDGRYATVTLERLPIHTVVRFCAVDNGR